MIPLHFGDASHAKYGIFHPAAGEGRAGRGIVLCTSYGEEAIRAHRALRSTAETLVLNRWNVLRFDYFATGDSAGDQEEFELERAVADIGDAAEELKVMTNAGGVFLLGLRLGGALAMRAAVNRRDVRGVVLWDPVVKGSRLLDEYLARWNGPELNVEGFVLADRLQASLRNMDICSDVAAFEGPLLLISTGPDEVHRALAGRHPGKIDYREIDAPAAWTKEENGALLPIPRAVIQEIAQWQS